MTDASNVDTGGMGRRISEVGDLLTNMDITAPGAPMGFRERLAADNGWTADYAARVDQEYRRFLLMAWMTPRMIVPSRSVDEAWHLHLVHTRHYWGELCGRILQKPLHHEPGDGGSSDAARHAAGFRDTLRLYAEVYGEPAPSDVWGAAPAEEAIVSLPVWTIAIAVGLASAFGLPAGIREVAMIVSIVAAIALANLTSRPDPTSSRKREYAGSRPSPTIRKTSPGVSRMTAGSSNGSNARTTMMDRTGDDGMAAATLFMDSTPTHAGDRHHGNADTTNGHHGHTHGHGDHGTADAPAAHATSCSTASCSAASCGGGGCGGGD